MACISQSNLIDGLDASNFDNSIVTNTLHDLPVRGISLVEELRSLVVVVVVDVVVVVVVHIFVFAVLR